MNQREFLKALKECSHNYDWELVPGYQYPETKYRVRAFPKRFSRKGRDGECCPITAVCRSKKRMSFSVESSYRRATKKLNLDVSLMDRILNAADSEYTEKLLREKILKAVGLA